VTKLGTTCTADTGLIPDVFNAVWRGHQNLLRFCAFVYRGIAHWVLLSIFLLIIPIAGYLPLYIIFQVSCLSLLPAGLWLFTAAVMTGHGDLITSAIEGHSQARRQIDEVMLNTV
jgi:hypothetical protein